MSIESPIYAVSSSNDAGYSVVFKQNGFDKPLAIYGHHVDNELHQDASLQSPFTNQHVGGLQNRHVAINTGNDSKLSRIERMAMEVSGGAIYIANPRNSNITTNSPTHNINIPYSQVGRNVWTKRPVNIANIQYNTSSAFLGNYTKSYQVYQTSNRATNNPAFVQRGGYNVEFAESVYISGTYDFGLPNRALPNGQYDQSVIVEKFSAPGGPEVMSEGFLDTYSGQFSVYNALPYRNLSVRVPLDILLSKPMQISGGYASGSSVTASFHKTNQNPRRIMTYSNVITPTYATSSEKDCEFIAHSIPRTDSQYVWITSSVDTSISTNVLFFLNVVSMSAGYDSRDIKIDGNSLYNWNSWQQIRGYERTSVKYLRDNNLFADISGMRMGTKEYTTSITNSKTITPLTIKYKPVIITVESKERVRV
jgi:hypothetical protein